MFYQTKEAIQERTTKRSQETGNHSPREEKGTTQDSGGRMRATRHSKKQRVQTGAEGQMAERKEKKKLFDIFDCTEGNLTALAESLRIN